VRRAFLGAVLAVTVITCWFLALLWLVLSVSQIAVERATTVAEPPCAVAEGMVACWP
jgi:hypothetical protein